MLHRQRAGVEKFFEQRVVAFGHHFDQSFVSGLRGLGHIRGDLAFFPFSVAVERIGIRLHAHQIHDALEVLLRADRQMNRNRRAPEERLHAFESAFETRALAVQLIDKDGPRQFEFFGERPDLLRLYFDAGHAIHDDQRRVGRHHRRLRVVEENIETRRIQQVDLLLLPLGGRDAGGNRDLALDLLIVEIRDGVAFIHAQQPRAPPEVNRRPAVSDVFPEWPCPTSATFRRSFVS